MAKKDAKGPKAPKESRESKAPKDSIHRATEGADLPATRAELLPLHEAARRRRNAAKLGSESWTEASMEVARIEVEIARLERAMDPPAD
jgi:hypothetical protein